jgi:hypothetical protein
MRKGWVLVLLLIVICCSSAFAAENSTNSGTVASKKFLIKGNIGWGIYPGLMGFLIYAQSANSLAYTSALTLTGDFLYSINSQVALGLHTAFIPIFHYNEGGNSASIEMVPIVGEIQFYLSPVFYINAGLGFLPFHGSGKTTNPGESFYDLLTGQNVGTSFDVWRGPYFVFTYALGWQIDLSGQDTVGLDIFLRSYHIIGHPGINALGELAQDFAGVPGFLLGIVVNTGIGVYYKF